MTSHRYGMGGMVPRRVAAGIALGAIIAASQVPCGAIAATSVSETKAAFDEAAKRYDDACTASEQAQNAADNADAALAQAKANAMSSIRSTYKGGDDAIGAIVSALCAGSISESVRELAAWQSIAEWSDGNIQTLVSDKAAADQAKADADAAVSEAQSARDDAESAYDTALKAQETAQKAAASKAAASVASASSIVSSGSDDTSSGGYLTVSQLRFRGVVYFNGWRITYYSQSVLPGGGLDIPGRHVEDGFVCDSDGRISVACSSLPKGTIVQLPFVGHTEGVVRDSGCAAGTIDIYTS